MRKTTFLASQFDVRSLMDQSDVAVWELREISLLSLSFFAHEHGKIACGPELTKNLRMTDSQVVGGSSISFKNIFYPQESKS